MNRKFSKIILTVLILIFFFPLVNFCLAQTNTNTGSENFLTLQVPIFDYTRAASLPEYIGKIFYYAMIVVIPLAILMILIGGIQWIFSAGQTQKIAAAKGRVISAVLGLGLAFLTYVFLSFVGITQLSMPGIQKIEPMPAPVLDFEFDQPDTFNQTPSGAPPTAGTMPRIFQCDYRDVPFNCNSPQKTVCSSGCGTVSVTMVLRYYGINSSIPQVVQFMGNGGYIGCSVSGTSPSGFAAIAKANNLNYQQVTINFETIKNYVVAGKPIIANVGNPNPGGTRTCKFTAHGHYIVLSGWDEPNNRFIINDPGGRATNRFDGTWAELTSGCILKGAYYVGH
jgi:hypothetical protein